MRIADPSLVLDRHQLCEVALGDEGMMRELLDILLDDTARQLTLLDSAIRDQDRERCRRLAHYAKGACASVGAEAAASLLRQLEIEGESAAFDRCAITLNALADALERLRAETGVL